MSSPKKEQTGNTVIVGIDFGTTYSGVAFTWSNKIERMEVITSWDSDLHSTSDEEKTPTAISYNSKGEVSWGYSIPFEPEQGKWFKLLLIDEKDLPDEIRGSTKLKEAREYLKKHNKTPISVIAEYLRLLWNHCNQRIIETVSRAVVNYSKFHIVITVPAIWPQYARVRMREAAKDAGMLTKRIAGETRLDIISEPEAAALATLSDMEGRCDVQVGDTFVVADCGGGTTDIISYEVINISPMAVKECVQGQGGLCGAVFVDEAFVQILKKKFGQKAWDKMEGRSRHRIIHDEWEHGIKPMFNGNMRPCIITMPVECIDFSAFMTGRRAVPKIEITADDVCTAFDPVVDKIGGMVAEQAAAIKTLQTEEKLKGPKYVILVGGFGRCKYLLTALKRFVGEDVEILQSRGSGPWTAICRGAVIHASSLQGLGSFTVQIQSRIARASYGTTVIRDWNSRMHKKKDKYWDEERQGWYARDQMDWSLKIGEEMISDKPVRFSYSRLYSTDEASQRKIEVKIYTSTESPPPPRKESSVLLLCTIDWDTEINIANLSTYTNQLGKVYYKLEYELQMGSKNVVANYEVKG
ncbi:hypothetical protein VTJ49DRAFT_6307 [Mycothermus thermophilus]|uniref:Actin-like ATPase domain-containing protein n=1 Tax=Humicola insolens TaxID=85995 RepID=A0ABR3V2V9_HUMIN